jgi:tRNA-dihydrouridine synthase B
MEYTGAGAVMIGRAALGNPWIFRQINEKLTHNAVSYFPSRVDLQNIIINHLKDLHDFYGESMGLKFARKHISWYLSNFIDGKTFSKFFNSLSTIHQQAFHIKEFLSNVEVSQKAA